LLCASSSCVYFVTLSLRFFLFFRHTATTDIYPLSLHDALPILAQMAFAAGAADLGPDHAEGPVLMLGESILRDGPGEGRPPCARLELLPRTEKGVPAGSAHISAWLVGAHETALPGRFRPVLAEHPV